MRSEAEVEQDQKRIVKTHPMIPVSKIQRSNVSKIYFKEMQRISNAPADKMWWQKLES